MKLIAIKTIKILLCILTLFVFGAAGLACFAYVPNDLLAALTSTVLWCSSIVICNKIA